MKTILFAMTVMISTSAFAVSEHCESLMSRAERQALESVTDINNGLKAGEISPSDAQIYRKNATLVIVQAQATCFELGLDSQAAVTNRMYQALNNVKKSF